MKILITGATGFLGSNLVRALKEKKFEIYAVVRENSNVDELQKYGVPYHCYNGMVQELISYFEEIKPELVIHTAAYFVAEHKWEQIDYLIQSNIAFSMHLLEAMSQSGVKYMINTTTSWEHYQDMEYNPTCLYAATKKMVEDMLIYYAEVKEIKIMTLVMYDSYGKKDQRGKLLNKLLDISKTGEVLSMSKGEQEIALLHIEDAIRAYEIAIEQIQSQEVKYDKYYLLPRDICTLKELVEKIKNITDRTLYIEWGELPYRKREVMKVYRKGKKLPNWNSQVSLQMGLLSMLEDEK